MPLQKIVLVRHGRYTGKELTPDGVQQIERLGTKLVGQMSGR